MPDYAAHKGRRYTSSTACYVPDPLAKEVSVDRITIAKQEAWRFVVRKRLDNLLSRSRGWRMSGDVEMHDTSPIMTEDGKSEEYSKRRSWYREEINGDDISSMIVEERTPSL